MKRLTAYKEPNMHSLPGNAHLLFTRFKTIIKLTNPKPRRIVYIEKVFAFPTSPQEIAAKSRRQQRQHWNCSNIIPNF